MTSSRLFLLLGVLASVQLPAATGDWREGYRRPATTTASAPDQVQHAQIELGRMLFFDPRLSGNGAISCATCHNPAFAWSDCLPVARGEGHRPLERHTPTLRDIALRPPYMHNGSEPTLRSVIELYNQGGRSKRPLRPDAIKPLNLTSSEVDDLIAFLRTLTGAPLAVAIPQLPVPGDEPLLEAGPASRTKSERVASTLAREDAPE